MTKILEDVDTHAFMQQGYTMRREGLVWHDTKTWVRTSRIGETVVAQIDGAPDVYVDLPNGLDDLPVRIEAADIDPYITNDPGQVEHFFGASGAIIVRLAQ